MQALNCPFQEEKVARFSAQEPILLLERASIGPKKLCSANSFIVHCIRKAKRTYATIYAMIRRMKGTCLYSISASIVDLELSSMAACRECPSRWYKYRYVALSTRLTYNSNFLVGVSKTVTPRVERHRCWRLDHTGRPRTNY